MNGLIKFSLNNPRAITVLTITILLIGALALAVIPADILPVYQSPAVQVLTFYNGMAATSVESAITARMERGTGMAAEAQEKIGPPSFRAAGAPHQGVSRHTPSWRAPDRHALPPGKPGRR